MLDDAARPRFVADLKEIKNPVRGLVVARSVPQREGSLVSAVVTMMVWDGDDWSEYTGTEPFPVVLAREQRPDA